MPSNADFVLHSKHGRSKYSPAHMGSPHPGRTLGERRSLTTFQGVIPAALLVGACPVSHPRSLCPPLRTSQCQAPPSSSKKTDFQVYADYSVGLLSFRQRENTLELFLPYKGYTKCHTLPSPLGALRRSLVPILCQDRWEAYEAVEPA